MGPGSLDKEIADLDRLMEERLRVSGRDLPARLRRAGRMLPRAMRRRARALIEAQTMLRTPKLARRVDIAGRQADAERLAAYLKTLDPAEARKTALIRLAAAIAFNLLVVAGLVLAVLLWRGLI